MEKQTETIYGEDLKSGMTVITRSSGELGSEIRMRVMGVMKRNENTIVVRMQKVDSKTGELKGESKLETFGNRVPLERIME